MPNNIVLIDFETTGLHPWKHAPLEFTAAIVTLPAFTEVDRYESGQIRVDPGDEVTTEALAVNGYQPHALHLGRDRTLVASDFNQFLLRYFPTGKITLMAHNPRLDYGMLEKMWEEWFPGAFAKRFSHRVIDTQSLAAGYFAFRELDKSTSLQNLCTLFGVENTAPHTSAGDVEAMRQMAKGLFGVVYGGMGLPEVPVTPSPAPDALSSTGHTGEPSGEQSSQQPTPEEMPEYPLVDGGGTNEDPNAQEFTGNPVRDIDVTGTVLDEGHMAEEGSQQDPKESAAEEGNGSLVDESARLLGGNAQDESSTSTPAESQDGNGPENPMEVAPSNVPGGDVTPDSTSESSPALEAANDAQNPPPSGDSSNVSAGDT